MFCSFVLPTSAITGGSISADDSVALKEEKTISNATLEDEFAEDRVIVVLSNAASTSLRSYTMADFSEYGCSEVNNLTQYTTELVNAKLRGDTSVAQRAAAAAEEQNVIVPQGFHDVNTSEFRQVLCLTLEEKGKQNVLDTIAEVIKHPDVIYAGPDYVIRARATTPNDPYRGDQWAINKIKLPQAWDITTGSAAVRVGVMDSGIDGTHPELTSRINTSLSRDFTSGYAVPVNSVTDPFDHGTHVAGIIGAATNNQTGISGTCFNVSLISLRILDSNGSGYSSWAYAAIDYARRSNIPLLNMSVGWYSDNPRYNENLEPILRLYPGLLICAADNDNKDIDECPNYPASISLNNLICVGASSTTDAKCDFSNYGSTSVDLFAPGENILSCYPVARCQDGSHDIVYTTHYSSGYHYMDGTSMAVPYVTGVAAFILAKYDIGHQQIKARILDGVDYVSGLNSYCSTSGRLNAYKALHNHSYTYAQYTASKHYRQCSCGLSVPEIHSWVAYGSSSCKCYGCGYVSNISINSVPGEFLQE